MSRWLGPEPNALLSPGGRRCPAAHAGRTPSRSASAPAARGYFPASPPPRRPRPPNVTQRGLEGHLSLPGRRLRDVGRGGTGQREAAGTGHTGPGTSIQGTATGRDRDTDTLSPAAGAPSPGKKTPDLLGAQRTARALRRAERLEHVRSQCRVFQTSDISPPKSHLNVVFQATLTSFDKFVNPKEVLREPAQAGSAQTGSSPGASASWGERDPQNSHPNARLHPERSQASGDGRGLAESGGRRAQVPGAGVRLGHVLRQKHLAEHQAHSRFAT